MKKLLSIILTTLFLLWNQVTKQEQKIPGPTGTTQVHELQQEIPEYTGKPFTVLNKNYPGFTKEETQNIRNIQLQELDRLGRCGTTTGYLGPETLATKKREPIGMVKPSGWQTVRYDFIDHYYAYNRCHLLGYQLTGINADPRNLITGTRYLNTIGMLPFENRTADYIRQSKNHVLYRVTPIFKENNLVAHGVKMEAWSIEDNGRLHFNVFIHNIQPGLEINYKNGKTKAKEN